MDSGMGLALMDSPFLNAEHSPREPPGLGRSRGLQTQSLLLEAHAGDDKDHGAKMLGLKKEAFVEVADEGQDDDGKVPLHGAKLSTVTRAEETDPGVTEGEAEDQQYNCQPGCAHLQRNVEKPVLRLRQKPRHSEDHAIGFALEAKPKRLVTVAEQRAPGDRIDGRAPYSRAPG